MKRNREYNLQLWQGLIQERKASGKTILAWCEENGYSKDTYHYWRKQIKAEAESGGFQNPPDSAVSAGPGVCGGQTADLSEAGSFVELRVPVSCAPDTHAEAASPAAVIRKEDIRIEVFRDTPECMLRPLLTALKDA